MFFELEGRRERERERAFFELEGRRERESVL